MHVTIIIIGESVNAPLQKRHSLCCVVSASAQSDTATPVVSLWSCNHRCLCETGTGGPEGGGEGEAEGSGGGGWQVGLWYSGEMAKLVSAERCCCSTGAEIAGRSVGGTSHRHTLHNTVLPLRSNLLKLYCWLEQKTHINRLSM